MMNLNRVEKPEGKYDVSIWDYFNPKQVMSQEVTIRDKYFEIDFNALVEALQNRAYKRKKGYSLRVVLKRNTISIVLIYRHKTLDKLFELMKTNLKLITTD